MPIVRLPLIYGINLALFGDIKILSIRVCDVVVYTLFGKVIVSLSKSILKSPSNEIFLFF